jgi:hypothetical protein
MTATSDPSPVNPAPAQPAPRATTTSPTAEDARVRDGALDLARQLVIAPDTFEPAEMLALFGETLDDRDPRAGTFLEAVARAEQAVAPGQHEAGGPGSTRRALNATREALEQAVEVAEETGRAVDRVQADPELSEQGKRSRVESLLAEHREKLAKRSGATFDRALANLAEREDALVRSLQASAAKPPSDTEALARRLDVMAALLVRGGEHGVERLALSYAAHGDPRAALVLEAAARSFADPLRVRALASKIRGYATERRVAQLFGNEARARVAAELHSLATTRARVENIRGMLAANPNEAKLILHNWR